MVTYTTLASTPTSAAVAPEAPTISQPAVEAVEPTSPAWTLDDAEEEDGISLRMVVAVLAMLLLISFAALLAGLCSCLRPPAAQRSRPVRAGGRRPERRRGKYARAARASFEEDEEFFDLEEEDDAHHPNGRLMRDREARWTR